MRKIYKLNKILIILALLIVISLKLFSQSSCEHYTWAVWTDQGSTNNATASLIANGQTISMSMTANYDFFFTPNIAGFSAFNGFSDNPTNTTVPGTTWTIGAGGTTTMCFSQTVQNPVLLLSSIGAPYASVSLAFSVPYIVLYDGGANIFIDSTHLSGHEGYCIIEFPGAFNCVTIYSTTSEYYTNLTWGIKTPPVADFTYTENCYDSINFSGFIVNVVNPVNISSWHWDFGDGSTSNLQNPTHLYSGFGNYNVQLVVTTNNNCVDTTIKTISVVNPYPVVNLGNDTTLLPGNSLTLNAANAGSTYQWSTGASTQTINVTTSGTYWVKVTNAGGCYSMDTINVTIDTTQYFINDCQNLDNNQIPQGWSLSEWIPTSNLSNGRLNAFIVDADGRLSKTGVIPNNTDSLILEWDGGVYYAYWGMYTGIVLTYNNNKNIEINHGSGYSWFGSGNKDFSDFSFYRGTGQTVLWGNDLNTLILPYDTTIFHYTVTVTNSFIKIKANNLMNGTQSFSTSYLFSAYDSISDFNLAIVQKITFLVHCTTDNSNWLDNPCIKIYTHNVNSTPISCINVETISKLPVIGENPIVSYKTINNKLYLFGLITPPYITNYICSNRIRTFDIITHTWDSLPSLLPYGIMDNTLASYYNNHFYFGPGFATGGSGGYGSHNKMIDVDLINNIAQETSNQFSGGAIWDISSIEVNGKIYFFGGWNGSPQSSIFEFNPTTNSFLQVASFTYPRNVVAPILGNDGWIYCFGYSSNNFERFNPATYQVQTMSATIPTNVYSDSYWHISTENSIYYFNSDDLNPTIYKYNYLTDVITNTGIALCGSFARRSIMDSNDPYTIYSLKYNPGHDVWNQDSEEPMQLVKLTLGGIPTVNLGNDTTLNQGQSLQLNAGTQGCTYQWSTGDTTQQINVTTSGTYWAKVTNAGGCTGSDTINVNFLPSYPMNDTTICKGSSVTFKANAPTTAGTWEYNQDFENTIIGDQWSDSTISTFNNTKVLGPYASHTVNLDLSNLPAHDSVEVSFDLYIHDSWDGNDGIHPDFWSLKINTDTLINTTFTSGFNISPQSYPQNYPASNSPQTGAYITNLPVRCAGAGGAMYRIDKLLLNNINNLQIKFIGLLDEDICNESWSMDNVKVKLLKADTVTHYLWSTGDTTQTITVTPAQTTTYIVTVTKGTTVYNDTATVYVMNPKITSVYGTSVCKGESLCLGVSTSNIISHVDSVPNFTYIGTLNNHLYYHSNYQTDWHTAKTDCQNKGGHLVTISSVEENDLLYNYCNGYSSQTWMGSTDEVTEGVWKWVTGEPYCYTNWNSGEPNNSFGIENYGVLWCVINKWNDAGGNGPWYFFLEIEKNHYLWSTGDTTQSVSVSPTQTTTYSVVVTNGNISCSDTITVNVVNIDAGANVTICQGDSTQLNASGGLIYTWTPTTGLSNPAIANPIAKPTQTTTYYVSAQSQGPNLIYNGNFELGNVGFYSAYGYSSNLGPASVYNVGSNPQTYHPGFSPCPDHTTGTGNMMIMNGADVPNDIVWKQTVNLKPNTNYAFSAWVQNVSSSTTVLAQLQFNINGNLIGPVYTCPSTQCVWGNFYTQWNSGSDTTAIISIVDQNTEAGGNDFCLDDIYFSELHTCGDSVVVTVAPQPQVNLGSDTSICKGDSVKLTYSPTVCGKSQLPTNLQQGLVAFYPFCGNANDESGNGNNGTVNGATLTTDRFGNTNSAYSFNGLNNYISLPPFNNNPSVTDFTVSLWAKMTSHNVNWTTGGGHGRSYLIDMRGDFPNSTLGTNSFVMDIDTVPNINSELHHAIDWPSGGCTEFAIPMTSPIAHWVHLVYKRQGSILYAYLNNQLLTTSYYNIGCSVSPNAEILSLLNGGRIGSTWSNLGPAYWYKGIIDDICFYNRALSASEVSQLYTEGGYASTCHWSTGDTTQSITVSPNQTTNYSLTVTSSAGCSASDTITVNVVPLPVVNLGNDTTICIGDSVLLNSGLTVGNTNYCNKSMLPANLQQGLVAFYPFCGNANDESGNGNNGTVNGATLTTDRFGNANSAYSFNGNQNIVVPNYNINFPSITVSFWFYINGPNSNARLVTHNWNQASTTGVFTSHYSDVTNVAGCSIHDINHVEFQNWTPPIYSIGNWYNFTFTFNAGIFKTYINGNFTDSSIISNPLLQSVENLCFGGNSSLLFNGNIDDIFIYNRAVSSSEVNQLSTLGSSSLSCHWSTGDTTQTIKVAPNQTTTYSVNVTNSNGCSASDSIKVNVAPLPVVNLGNDTAFCLGNTLNLNASNIGSTYLWQDNSTNQIYNVNLQGTYWVKVTTPFGCKGSDTINVVYNPAPVVNLGNDTTICQGETLLLDATLINATYLWQDGSTNATFNVSSQGTYWVKVTNSNGCTATDTIHVTLTPLVVNIGNDTTICQGNNVTLDAGNMGATYVWSTGVATQQINVNSSGAYWVKVTNGNCFNSDTININVIPKPLVNLGNDTTICHLGSITLDAGNIGSTYLWNTTATTQQINVSTTGNYWVKVSNNGCIGGDTINIAFIPLNVNIGNDTTICEGDNINLNAGNIGSTYLWNTGVATQTISVGTVGNYWVNVTNGNCIGSDTININVAQKPIVNLGNDTIMCPGDLVVLSAGAGFSSYLWSDGSTQSTLNVNNPGTYTVTVSNSGCKATDLIVIAECNSDIWVPNVFTPNSDGKNDTFHPVCTNITDISMYIYNRWGNQIYEGTGATLEWDGKYQGTACPDGVYYFLIKYTQKDNGHTTQKQLHGSVTLLK